VTRVVAIVTRMVSAVTVVVVVAMATRAPVALQRRRKRSRATRTHDLLLEWLLKTWSSSARCFKARRAAGMPAVVASAPTSARRLLLRRLHLSLSQLCTAI